MALTAQQEALIRQQAERMVPPGPQHVQQAAATVSRLRAMVMRHMGPPAAIRGAAPPPVRR